MNIAKIVGISQVIYSSILNKLTENSEYTTTTKERQSNQLPFPNKVIAVLDRIL